MNSSPARGVGSPKLASMSSLNAREVYAIPFHPRESPAFDARIEREKQVLPRLGSGVHMNGPKEAKQVEAEQDDAAIDRMENECPHCGEKLKSNEDRDPSVAAVNAEPCKAGGTHRWNPAPREGENQKTG